MDEFKLPGEEDEFSLPGEAPRKGEVLITPNRPMSDLFPIAAAYTSDPQKFASMVNADRNSPYVATVDKETGHVVAFEPDPMTGNPKEGSPIYGSEISTGIGYTIGSSLARTAQEQGVAAALGAARGARGGIPGMVAGAASAIMDPIKGLGYRVAATGLTEAGASGIQTMQGAPLDVVSEARNIGAATSMAGVGDISGTIATKLGGLAWEHGVKPGAIATKSIYRNATGGSVHIDVLNKILRPANLDEAAFRRAQETQDKIIKSLGDSYTVPAHQLEAVANPKKMALMAVVDQLPGGNKVAQDAVALNSDKAQKALVDLVTDLNGRITPEVASLYGIDVPKWKLDIFTNLQSMARDERSHLVNNMFKKDADAIFRTSDAIDTDELDIISGIDDVAKSPGLDVRDFMADLNSLYKNTQPGTPGRTYLDSIRPMFTTDRAAQLQPRMDKLQSELTSAREESSKIAAEFAAPEPGKPAFLGGPSSRLSSKLAAEDDRISKQLVNIQKSLEEVGATGREKLLSEQATLLDRLKSIRQEMSDLAPKIESESNQALTDVRARRGEYMQKLTEKEIAVNQRIASLENSIVKLQPQLDKAYKIKDPQKLSDILTGLEYEGFEGATHADALVAQLREKLLNRYESQGYMTKEMRDQYHQLIVQKQFLTGKESALGFISSKNAADLDSISNYIFNEANPEQFKVAKQVISRNYPEIWDYMVGEKIGNIMKDSRSIALRSMGLETADQAAAKEVSGLLRENISKQVRGDFFKQYPKLMESVDDPKLKSRIHGAALFMAATSLGHDPNSATFMRAALGDMYKMGTGEAFDLKATSALLDPKGEAMRRLKDFGDKWSADLIATEERTAEFARALMSGAPMENYDKFRNLALMEERKNGINKKWAEYMYLAMTSLGKTTGREAGKSMLDGKIPITPATLQERRQEELKKQQELQQYIRKKG